MKPRVIDKEKMSIKMHNFFFAVIIVKKVIEIS